MALVDHLVEDHGRLDAAHALPADHEQIHHDEHSLEPEYRERQARVEGTEGSVSPSGE